MSQQADATAKLPGFSAFLSYAHEDEAFARQLETQIEAQRPLAGGAALRVFRDRLDFSGSEYHRALETHLRDSASLVVICSPHARQSQFVGDEIRRFAALHGAERIYPVLLAGLPDNEADDQKAFPSALLEVARGIPLAADYRSFDPSRHRLVDAKYEAEWYKLLGNIHGVSPAEVRQHDERVQVRAFRRRIALAIVALLALATLLAVFVFLWQRAEKATAEAERQNQRAEEALRKLAETSPRAQTELADLTRKEAPPTAPPRDSSEGALAPRVYFHIREEGQRAAAQRLAREISRPDLIVPGIQLLDVGPRASELRYFRAGEKEQAERIAQAIRDQGVEVAPKQIAGYENSKQIRPGHFELWLAPEAATDWLRPSVRQ